MTHDPARPSPPDPDRSTTDPLDAFVHLANGVTHLHPDDLAPLVRSSAALLGGRDPCVLLVDIEQLALHALDPEDGRTYAVDEDGSSPGTAYRTEQTVRERTDDADSVRLWIPLMDSAERLGVLGVTVDDGQHGEPREPGAAADQRDAVVERWRAFASVVGETVVSKMAYGDSIVRARRLRDVPLAAEMRWAILPPLTFTSAQVEISGVLVPAHEIAGDTFDYAITGEVLSVAVLDAMGHGLEASRMPTLAVAEYRRGRRSGGSLGELLRGMDEVIASQFGDHRYVTGQLGELDLAAGRLTVVNAGHPAPLLFRGGADVGDLPCVPCPPMGLGLITTYEARVELAADDVVLFHTDGITEARSPTGEQFGRPRLAAIVADGLRRDDRPAEILRRIVRAVSEHTDGPMQDDATTVFLRMGHRPGVIAAG